MRKLLLMAVIAPLVLPFPANAQQDSYRTPEYSGPMAHIESRDMGSGIAAGDRYRPIVSPTPPDDARFEHVTRGRHGRITDEMDRRRDEIIRANKRHILKLND